MSSSEISEEEYVDLSEIQRQVQQQRGRKTVRVPPPQSGSSSSGDDDWDIPLSKIRKTGSSAAGDPTREELPYESSSEPTRTEPVAGPSSESPSKRKASENANDAIHKLVQELTDDDFLDWFDDTDTDPDFSISKLYKDALSSEDDASDQDDEEPASSTRITHTFAMGDISSNAGQRAEEETGPETLAVQNYESNVETDKGPKRKRLSKEDQERLRDEQNEKALKKHPVQPRCNPDCAKKCNNNFTQEDREKLNENYWRENNWANQKAFILKTATKKEPARKRVGNSKKKCTVIYTLPGANDNSIQVCKTFYLTTLGFKKNNDTVVMKTLARVEDQLPALQDRRGKGPKKHAFDHTLIMKHVESYGPAVPHYRREHAPLRRYLPSDLSLRGMYEDFLSSSARPISYNLYYKVFKSMNISMTCLGNEECEVCTLMKLHKVRCECEDTCAEYSRYILHKRKYTKARQEYKMDIAAMSGDAMKDTCAFSADLQRVIMLPRMEQFKSAIFCHRLIVFNETFASLGKGGDNVAVLWHEGIAGRKDEDICSAFHKFLLHQRDAKKIIIWVDNCAGQNKNWTLFTMLVSFVNNEDSALESVTLKYFEPGHTFMAADSVHAAIERVMKKREKIYDFEDFSACVSSASCTVKEMKYTDFAEWTSGLSYHILKKATPRPYLADMVVAEFRRGSRVLYYKTAFSGNYFQVPFLIEKFILQTATCRKRARGVEPAKKKEVLEKLVPLMPKNRWSFWRELEENVRSKDLTSTV